MVVSVSKGSKVTAADVVDEVVQMVNEYKEKKAREQRDKEEEKEASIHDKEGGCERTGSIFETPYEGSSRKLSENNGYHQCIDVLIKELTNRNRNG